MLPGGEKDDFGCSSSVVLPGWSANEATSRKVRSPTGQSLDPTGASQVTRVTSGLFQTYATSPRLGPNSKMPRRSAGEGHDEHVLGGESETLEYIAEVFHRIGAS